MNARTATTRRRFFCTAGAALAAPLAVATAEASNGIAGDNQALKAELALLADMNAIRDLHEAYARLVNAREHEALANLFADPAAARAADGIRRVSADQLEPSYTIEVSADHESATARIACTVEIETPIEPSCALVEMARAQGGGVVRRSERGVFENAYVKERGRWKIKRIAYRAG